MNLDDKWLEPGALLVCEDEGTAQAIASIAISLKRMADALTEGRRPSDVHGRRTRYRRRPECWSPGRHD